MRNLAALVFIVGILAAHTTGVSAQGPSRVEPDPATRVTLDAHNPELASIDTQSDWVRGLYISGVILHVGGLVTIVATGIAGFCLDFGAGGCASARDLSITGAVVGGTVALLGFAAMMVGVGLDVDSGHRRHALLARTSVGLVPIAGGAALAFGGGF